MLHELNIPRKMEFERLEAENQSLIEDRDYWQGLCSLKDESLIRIRQKIRESISEELNGAGFVGAANHLMKGNENERLG